MCTFLGKKREGRSEVSEERLPGRVRLFPDVGALAFDTRTLVWGIQKIPEVMTKKKSRYFMKNGRKA